MNDVEWNDLISRLPGVHILQTAEWGKVKAVYGWEVIRKTWTDGQGTVTAAAQVLRRRIRIAGIPFPYCVLYIPRGPMLVHIIMPQAVRTMLPPLAGQVISTIKDSAIVSVISIQELTFQGSQLMATTYLTFEVWTCVALLYFALTFTCSLAAARLEHRLRDRYSL